MGDHLVVVYFRPYRPPFRIDKGLCVLTLNGEEKRDISIGLGLSSLDPVTDLLMFPLHWLGYSAAFRLF